MMGKCSVRHYAKGQGVIALSSGEAEYHGLVSIVAALLGSSSLAADWGIRLKPLAFMDATAGISIGSRKGLGRLKHIDTVFLWCQEVVASGRVKIAKKHTSEMVADVLTKPVTQPLMEQMVEAMGYRFTEGGHRLALQG